MLSQQTHDCKKELRAVDLRATPARVALLQLLEKSSAPLDVATILTTLTKQAIDADPATVFRIVNTFTEKGIVRQLQFNEGKSRYELASKKDHHHLICESCGSVADIEDCGIDTLEKTIKRKKKFLVKHHALEFFGVCHACSRLERQRLAGR